MSPLPWHREGLLEIRRPEDRAALRLHGHSTIDDVWQAIGKDQDQGIERLVQTTGVDRSRLVQDLLDSAVLVADEKGSWWPHRHALELAIAAAALALALLAAWAAPRSRAVGIALRDLRAGERVSAEALHGADPARLADRRLTRNVARGGFVDPAWLAEVQPLAEQTLQGRYRLSLRIRGEDLKLLPSLPALTSLAVAAAGEGAPRAVLLRGVPVLSSERSQESAILVAALSEAQVAEVLPLLPEGEVRVLRPLP